MALTLEDLGIKPTKQTQKKQEPKQEKKVAKPKKISKIIKKDRFSEIISKVMIILGCILIGSLSSALVIKGILLLFRL